MRNDAIFPWNHKRASSEKAKRGAICQINTLANP